MKYGLLWCLLWSASASAAETQSAYVGQEHRPIKSLSAKTIEAYRTAQGMGLAKAAELNGYPGPLHVLQLAEKLNLTAAQSQQMEDLYQSMQQEARPLGEAIVALEAELDSHFANRTITADLLQRLTLEIGQQQGALRAVHLQRHLAAARILSPTQTAAYFRLRGYGHAGHAHQSQHGEHSDHQ